MSTIPFLRDGVEYKTGVVALKLSAPEGDIFIASGAVAKGDWVTFDTAKLGAENVLYVKTAVATALGAVACGVAVSAALDGEKVQVVTSGYVAGAKVTGSTAVGSPLSVDATDGTGTLADAANAIVCGQSLDAESGGFAACWVFKRF